MSNILEGNNYVTRDELKRIESGKATNVWLNPVDGIIYTGETVVKGGIVPTYEEPIFDTKKYRTAEAKAKAGTLDADEAQFMPWIGHFADLYNERVSATRQAASASGVHTNTQFSAIDTTTFLNGFVNAGSNIRAFTIPDAVQTTPVNGLEYQSDVYERFNISQDVPEGTAAWAKRGSVTVVSYDLTKDVGHVAATDESVLKARQDIMGNAIANVASDFKRSKSAKIADVLEGASETNVGDWDAFTSGLSDANPIEHLRARFNAINAANGTADTIISTDVGFYAFVGNTFVRGAYNRQKEGLDSTARAVNIDLLPGCTWYIDNELAAASVIVMDKRAVRLVQGPMRVGQYRTEDSGVTGYVAREWYQAKREVADWIAELATVTT